MQTCQRCGGSLLYFDEEHDVACAQCGHIHILVKRIAPYVPETKKWGRPPSQVRKDHVHRVLSLRKSGLTYTQIAEQTGLSIWTISRIVKLY